LEDPDLQINFVFLFTILSKTKTKIKLIVSIHFPFLKIIFPNTMKNFPAPSVSSPPPEPFSLVLS
jgi:hypothetical protein